MRSYMCRSASLILRCISTCITIATNPVSLLLPCVCTWVYAHVGGGTCAHVYVNIWRSGIRLRCLPWVSSILLVTGLELIRQCRLADQRAQEFGRFQWQIAGAHHHALLIFLKQFLLLLWSFHTMCFSHIHFLPYSSSCLLQPFNMGSRAWTQAVVLAYQALSQLSYAPSTVSHLPKAEYVIWGIAFYLFNWWPHLGQFYFLAILCTMLQWISE